MKLKIYDKKTCSFRGHNIGVRSMNISRTNGTCMFSSTLQSELKIKVGQSVQIAQDEESKNDWYISFSESPTGFIIREKKNGGYAKNCMNTMYFINKAIANKMLDFIKASKSATMLIGEKPIKVDGMDWYKIVTSKPLRIN